MLSKINYKELATIRFLNKSSNSNSKYYSISFGIAKIKVRVSDHYSKKWKGDFQIVVYNPKNIGPNDVKARAYNAMENKYSKILRKSGNKKEFDIK